LELTEIFEIIRDLSDSAAELREDSPDPSIFVESNSLLDVMKGLRNRPELAFDALQNQTAIHEGENFRLFWVLYSYSRKHTLTVESIIPLDKPRISSVSEIWKTANWLEREIFDLFGIEFVGHTDLRRIMLPEDWEGFPLRKDYQTPSMYQDVDNTPSEITESFKLD